MPYFLRSAFRDGLDRSHRSPRPGLPLGSVCMLQCVSVCVHVGGGDGKHRREERPVTLPSLQAQPPAPREPAEPRPRPPPLLPQGLQADRGGAGERPWRGPAALAGAPQPRSPAVLWGQPERSSAAVRNQLSGARSRPHPRRTGDSGRQWLSREVRRPRCPARSARSARPACPPWDGGK